MIEKLTIDNKTHKIVDLNNEPISLNGLILGMVKTYRTLESNTFYDINNLAEANNLKYYIIHSSHIIQTELKLEHPGNFKPLAPKERETIKEIYTVNFYK